PLGLRQPEGPVGAEGADLEGLDRHLEVIVRGGGAGEVQDVVEGPLDDEVPGHVVLDEREPGVGGEALDVVDDAREEVVHADDLVPAREEELAQMRADEAGSARDEDAHGGVTPGGRACGRSNGTRTRSAASAPAPRRCGRRRRGAGASPTAGAPG